MPGVFDSRFWETIILQVSSSEPAVFHAVVALASTQRGQELRECLRRDSNTDEITNQWDRFALQQYNKAIADLQIHFAARNHRSLQIALTTCIIFTCIELLRGSYTAANTHIDNGIKLLSNLQRQSRNRHHQMGFSPKITVTRQLNPQSLDDDLLEAFARINIQSVLFGYPSRYLHVVAEDPRSRQHFHIPEKFGSLEEARQYLEVLLNSVLHLIEASRSDKYLSLDTISLLRERKALQASLSAWLDSYEASVPTLLPTLNPRTGMGLPLLRIYHIMTSIMLSTCPQPNTPWSEMVYDSHTHSFSSLVMKARSLANLQDLPIPYEVNTGKCPLGSRNFIVDMGIIPPLYYTAIKCRVPSIRRQAIDVLTGALHRETMWDGEVVAAIAKRVIALEEGDFYQKDSSPPVQTKGVKAQGSSQFRGFESSSLPEAYRFEDVQVIMQDGTKNKGKIICRRRRRYSGEVTNPSSSSSGLSGPGYSTANGNDEWEVIEDSFHCDVSHVH
ncbi:hypothetical protein VTN77DRAFT_4547 [Rasamsonia byssochlamydoides]|uniref:uncharacterized protein n=1 Tax=Rasamsonia byssochlamydoides TaxID=89139 RepID=UPI0037448091